MSKREYLSYGFRQLPEVIAVSKKFTHAEKLIISKVFDMMWKNKDDIEYAGSAFMSNDYIRRWCGVSKNTIIDCKRKCKALSLFDIVKRFNDSDMWFLKSIPDILVEEYEDFISEEKRIKEMKNMSTRDLLNITTDMTTKEREDFFRDNPELGVKV